MKAHSNKLNGMRLPCPRCHAPASIDARVCSCGYRFVAEHTPQVKPRMPELRQVVPGFKPIVHKFPELPGIVEKCEAVGKTGENEASANGVSTDRSPDSSLAEPKTVLPVNAASAVPIPLMGLTTVVSEEAATDRPTTIRRGFIYGVVGSIAAAALLFAGFTAYQNNAYTNGSLPPTSGNPERNGTEANVSVPLHSQGIGTSEKLTDQPPETNAETEYAPVSENKEGQQPNRPATRPAQTDSERVVIDPAANGQNVNSEQSAGIAENKNNRDAETSNNTAIATARCADGTFSYRKTRSGTCSHRGGVAEWLSGTKNPGGNSVTEKQVADKPRPETATPDPGRKFILGSRGGCYYLGSNGNKNYVDKSFCN